MRYAVPILFLILGLLGFQSWLNNAKQNGPSQEAVAFLSDIQSGNASKVVRHFGSNICHCPKKNGWGSYLAYQTGQEPNLAFLFGHPFVVGEAKTTKIESPPEAQHGIPWEDPEDYVVDVPLQFNHHQYSPFFLPRPMACGQRMNWSEFESFISNPNASLSENLTLRLRPALDKGAIKFDTSTIESDVYGEFKFLNRAKESFDENKYPAKIKEILNKNSEEQKNQIMIPEDTGIVIHNKSAVSIEKIKATLPHLRSITIRLHIVRRGKLQPWTVSHFLLLNPELEKN